ncbi:uncharacterized protein TNCT_66691 [Trichonephila clavata]|uniref:Uncharacterized protein n=1 Tax=Trichonephila clavata TaxID=2740835 RepID=A0A8X6K9S9_TRICU|nr:uncharacterized protein TNCT_66691 [Trichonephila clavata]
MIVNMSRDLIDMADENDSFLKEIGTGDETWYFLNNPQTKRQSSEWEAKTSPWNKKLRLDKSRGKIRRSN